MIGEIISGLAGVVDIIDTQTKRAERKEQVDLLALASASKTLQEINEKLQVFKDAADRVDTDADYAALVRDKFTRK